MKFAYNFMDVLSSNIKLSYSEAGKESGQV
jgi:hypothetical protein